MFVFIFSFLCVLVCWFYRFFKSKSSEEYITKEAQHRQAFFALGGLKKTENPEVNSEVMEIQNGYYELILLDFRLSLLMFISKVKAAHSIINYASVYLQKRK